MDPMSMSILKAECLSVLNYPVEVVASKKSSLLAKVISGVAIAALSMLSFGYYALHAYRFFAYKKVVYLQKDLEKAIGRQDCNQVRTLFKDYPILKTEKYVRDSTEDSDSHISLILPLAAEKGCLEMVTLLVDSGATLNAYSRGMRTAVERALDNNHDKVAYYLLDKGADFNQHELFRYVSGDSNLEMILYLVKKFEEIRSGGVFSLLGLVSLKYHTDPDKCKEVMKLLIEKECRLTSRDLELEIPPDAKQFIDDQIKDQAKLVA